jgi:DNA-binding response OmpR family regulator
VEKSKILLVEEDAAILRICTLYLRAENFQVLSLDKPELLLATTREEKPDLVVLDINKISSPALKSLKEFRLESDFANIPLLVLMGGEAVRERIYNDKELLPDEHLAKPFIAEELVARINALLRIRNFIERGYSANALYSTNMQTSKVAMRR